MATQDPHPTPSSALDELDLTFEFKPFAEMTPADYARIGFKSGLEIHQQLLTARKLFCRCPAGRYSDTFHAEILRHMRPTLSELGEYDGTALMEFKTRKEIIYHINRETVCTYEMDDTPPFELNDEALHIALGVGLLLGCTLVDEIHIARKQYLDGSIPTGFQRTTIVGVDGSIPYQGRAIPIVQLGLEEDACREVSDVGHRRTYITDRLGMPLIETVTAPVLQTPQEVAEVGQLLRRLVRSTGQVRTGLGAARQDVNVSVRGGTRVEIKGVPRLPLIPLLTYNEALRQYSLLRLRQELRARGITPATFAARSLPVGRLLRKTRYEPIRAAIAAGCEVACVVLEGFAGLLRWPTQTDTFFSRELSDRVRVVACLTTLPNLIHTDGLSENLASAEWQALRRTVEAGPQDALVLVWGEAHDAAAGAQEVILRAREATLGVPSETRQALRDGTTGFERILPGPDRMYPDTDLPPRAIAETLLAEIRARLPEPVWEREAWYRELGLPPDVIGPLAQSPFAALFRELVRELGLAPRPVAEALIRTGTRLRREGRPLRAELIPALRQLLVAFGQGRLLREVLTAALRDLVDTGRFTADALPAPADVTEVERQVQEALGRLTAPPGPLPAPEHRLRAGMGLAMASLRGRVPGRQVRDLLAARLEEVVR
ncbi:MAG: Glu-tRNA(Gln) amidotransferase subunit GatE [Myxococcota bacterium]|jgi:glutamyl-tRNA(Gln) amidotransferase subunit E|nr:Glu-tRNA(Gln) amidotransferase subunit GatE [Myxococcota bacterium]